MKKVLVVAAILSFALLGCDQSTEQANPEQTKAVQKEKAEAKTYQEKNSNMTREEKAKEASKRNHSNAKFELKDVDFS